MKWVKNFCLEIFHKVKDHITTVIAIAIVSIFFFVFKTYLLTVYAFTFPLWIWVLVIVAPSAVAILIFAVITTRRRRLSQSHLLDGTNDICMALVRWIVDRCKEGKVITVKYDDVDKECGLVAGTAKNYLLPGVNFLIESGFPVRAGLPGEKTIMISFGKNTEIYKDLELPKDIPATSTKKLLTDPKDILNKIVWWLGEQKSYVIKQGRAGLPLTWHFDVIDKKLHLSPGSTKKHLPKIFKCGPCPFPVKILNKGPETIMFSCDPGIIL